MNGHYLLCKLPLIKSIQLLGSETSEKGQSQRLLFCCKEKSHFINGSPHTHTHTHSSLLQVTLLLLWNYKYWQIKREKTLWMAQHSFIAHREEGEQLMLLPSRQHLSGFLWFKSRVVGGEERQLLLLLLQLWFVTVWPKAVVLVIVVVVLLVVHIVFISQCTLPFIVSLAGRYYGDCP